MCEHLATSLLEICIHVGRSAKLSTQRCHIALPSRLATMEPQRSNLIEFERIARTEAQHRLPIKNGIAFGFLDELARIRRKLPFVPTRISAVCIFRFFASRREIGRASCRDRGCQYG